MMEKNTLIIAVIFVWMVIVEGQRDSAAKKLMKDLMATYDKSVRPVRDDNKAVNVTVTLNLLQIKKLDEREQILSIFLWVGMYWKDEFLAWNETNYGNLKSLVIPSNRIWLPDIAFTNSADNLFLDGDDGTFRAVVKHNGSVMLWRGGKMSVMCTLDITYYPFDDQKCEIILLNWAYTGQEVDLLTQENIVILPEYTINGQWDIIGNSVKRIEIEYGGPLRYAKLMAELTLRRKSGYYVLQVILPCIMISLLALFSFYLPAASGEKVSVGITVLLSFSVFQLMVAENLPKTSDYLPILCIYLLSVMALTAASIVATFFILKVYHTPNHHIPSYLRTLAFSVLAKIPFCCPTQAASDFTDRTSTESQSSTPSTVSLISEISQANHKTYEANRDNACVNIKKVAENGIDEESALTVTDSRKDAEIIVEILDRFFFVLFSFITISITLSLLVFYPLSKPTV